MANKPYISIEFGNPEDCYMLDDLGLTALENIMGRATYDARNDREREVAHCMLAVVFGARANANKKDEDSLEIPF